MKPSVLRLSLAVVFSVLAAPTALSAAPALSFNESTGGVALHLDRTLGWRFNVLQPIVVDGVGWFDQNGNGLTLGHRIGIWNSAGNLLADGTVGAGIASPLDGQFRTATISPITLAPGTNYIVGGQDFTADTERLACGSTAGGPCNGFSIGQPAELSQIFDPRIQWTGAMYSDPTTDFIRPNLLVISSQGYYGPSFSIAVPEPASLLLAVIAGAAIAHRRRPL